MKPRDYSIGEPMLSIGQEIELDQAKKMSGLEDFLYASGLDGLGKILSERRFARLEKMKQKFLGVNI